ncbi:sigma factor [Methylobacterium sp. A49B]
MAAARRGRMPGWPYSEPLLYIRCMISRGGIRVEHRMPFHPDTRSGQRADELGSSPDTKESDWPLPPRAQTCMPESRPRGQPAQVSRGSAGSSQTPDPDLFRDDLLRWLPELRGFANSITATATQAEDLVQETLLRAWQGQDHYHLGSDLKAWVFAMMRKSSSCQTRKAEREVPDVDRLREPPQGKPVRACTLGRAPDREP